MRTTPCRIGSVKALSLLVGIAILSAGDALAYKISKVPYRDKVHKFSMRYPLDWEQIPVEAGQDTEVLKYYDPSERGFRFRPEVVVVKIDKLDAPVTAGGESRNQPRFPGMKPKTAWDATVGLLAVSEERRPSPDKPKKVKSKDGVPGKLYRFEVPFGLDSNDKDTTLFVVHYSFETDAVEYGIMMTAPMRQKKKFEKDFLGIGKSFRVFDEKAKEVETIDSLDDVNITASRRKEIEASMVRGWGIRVSPKKNYLVIYNTAGGDNQRLAFDIANRIEAIREQIYEVQFPAAKKIDAVSIVRVCGSRGEYHAYGGPPGSAGYWHSGTEELVFYDASRSKKTDDDTLAVLYHEAFHQYIFYSVGSVAPHSWFNEGHGDYYAGAKYSKGRFKVKTFDWRLPVIKKATREGSRPFSVKTDSKGNERKIWGSTGYTPLADLVRFSKNDYYSYPGVSYAQGWSFIYFLREIVPRNKTYNKKWGHILDTYFDTLKAEVNPELAAADKKDEPKRPKPPTGEGDEPDGEGDDDEGGEISNIPPPPSGRSSPSALKKAVDTAFEGVDFEELERAWLKAVKSYK